MNPGKARTPPGPGAAGSHRGPPSTHPGHRGADCRPRLGQGLNAWQQREHIGGWFWNSFWVIFTFTEMAFAPSGLALRGKTTHSNWGRPAPPQRSAWTPAGTDGRSQSRECSHAPRAVPDRSTSCCSPPAPPAPTQRVLPKTPAGGSHQFCSRGQTSAQHSTENWRSFLQELSLTAALSQQVLSFSCSDSEKARPSAASSPARVGRVRSPLVRHTSRLLTNSRKRFLLAWEVHCQLLTPGGYHLDLLVCP